MKIIDLTNKRFGKLIVLRKLKERGNNGQIKWECICDCGNNHTVTGESIRSGKSKSCGCLRKNPPSNKIKDRNKAVWRQLYNSTIIKRNKKRNVIGNISLKYFSEALSIDNCFYCGIEPTNSASDIKSGKKISETIIKYNGIDRIDSNEGYILGNVVTCCKYCNVAKNTMTTLDFYIWVKRIYKHLMKSVEFNEIIE